MARPFITNREDIPGFLRGKVPKLNNIVLRTGIKQFDDAAEGGFYAKQLIRFSKGKMYDSEIGPVWSSIFLVLHEIKMALSKRF